MKIGIMQPYFFPYAQQFRHIRQCDRWVVFDTPKYSRKSWINRNRIINRDIEWSYISVPVAKGASKGPICDAALADTGWREALQDQLKVYAATAPYYAQTLEVVDACIGPEADTIAELNTRILTEVCRRLGVTTPIMRLSELSLDLPAKADPGEWRCSCVRHWVPMVIPTHQVAGICSIRTSTGRAASRSNSMSLGCSCTKPRASSSHQTFRSSIALCGSAANDWETGVAKRIPPSLRRRAGAAQSWFSTANGTTR